MLCLSDSYSQSPAVIDLQHNNVIWDIRNPGQTNVFVKNYGQFDGLFDPTKPVLFGVLNDVNVFFNSSGVSWQLEKIEDTGEGESKEESFSSIQSNIQMEWLNANTKAEVFAQDRGPGYHTYADANHNDIKAEGYKKLVYKELYPGIDVEYIIPEKGGIKYTITLQPGADVGALKMRYSDESMELNIDHQGHLKISTPGGDLIDHAPIAYYKENNEEVPIQFNLSNNTITFKLPDRVDASKTLIIDPWTVSLTPSGPNNILDVGYDQLGNVYAGYRGSTNRPTISKYDAAGNFQWKMWYQLKQGLWYSEFKVLPSGTIFIASGFSSTDRILAKISGSSGLLLNSVIMPDSLNDEAWVVDYNGCTDQMLIGGGGLDGTICLKMGVDSNLSGSFIGNTFNGSTDNANDMAEMIIDDNGTMYSFFNGQVGADHYNTIYQSQPPYTTFSYSQVRTLPGFREVMGGQSEVPYSNRLNVMAINSNYLFFFDGRNLEARLKSTGNMVDSIVVDNSYKGGWISELNSYKSEGIAADECNNVYVGGRGKVHIYAFNGTTLSSHSTITVPNDVYDIALDRANQRLYVVGKYFITSIDVPDTLLCSNNFLNVDSLCSQNGTARVVASGGLPPYTYVWNNGATTATFTDTPGTYYVTVYDASCSFPKVGYDTVTIADTSFIQVNALTSPTRCSGACDGVANVTITNGASSLTYNWSNASTDTFATGLCPGLVSVTVTDSSGCLSIGTITLPPPDSITAIILDSNNLSCSGLFADGSAKVTVTGGTSPYNYTWSPFGGNADSAVGLTAGVFTVFVTDSNGCSDSDQVHIMEPPPLLASITSGTDASCHGLDDGSLTVTPTGGTPGYSYLWSDSSTLMTASGLPAGNYMVTVTDTNGCSTIALGSIVQPDALTDSLFFTNSSCGDSSGSIGVVVSGGKPSYSFLWSSGDTDATVTGLPAGTYYVTITDSAGCTLLDTGTINDNAAGIVTLSVLNEIACHGQCNGATTVLVTGGVQPLTYSWSNTSTDTFATGLCAGLVSVTVTDSAGCSSTASVTLTQPAALTDSLFITNTSCGDSNGVIGVVVWGGSSPFGFLWSSGDTDSVVTGLPAGVYYLTITDSAGCSLLDTGTINDNNAGIVTDSVVDEISCYGICDGSVMVSIVGGISPYTYDWSTGDTSVLVNSLCAGTYSVSVLDSMGCLSIASVTLTQPDTLTDSLFTTHTNCGDSSGSIGVIVSGGKPSYGFLWSSGDTDATATGLPAGTYYVTITDSAGCTLLDTGTINDSSAGFTTASVVSTISCHDTCDGAIQLNPTGGMPPYSFAWSNGRSDHSLTGLCADTLTVTVSDSSSCDTVLTFNLPNPLPLNPAILGPDSVCQEDTIVLVASGNGSFTWCNGDTTTTRIITATSSDTTYCLIVSNGSCQDTVDHNIIIQPLPVVAITGPSSICAGDSLTLTATGSEGTYHWSTGDTTQTIVLDTVLSSSHYSVTLSDDCGTVSDTHSVRVIPGPSIKVRPDTMVYYGDEVTLWVQFDTGTVTWFPTNDLSCVDCPRPSITVTGDVVYTAIVTGPEGCIVKDSVTITMHDGCSAPFVPNAFSPDNDGVNDILYVRGHGYRDFAWSIFDRWGELIHFSTDQTEGWDGAYEKMDMQGGVVVYTLKMICYDGEVIEKSGNVTLIR